MTPREGTAWVLLAATLALTVGRAAASNCESTTTTTTTAPPLISEPPHLVPPITLERLPETR